MFAWQKIIWSVNWLMAVVLRFAPSIVKNSILFFAILFYILWVKNSILYWFAAIQPVHGTNRTATSSCSFDSKGDSIEVCWRQIVWTIPFHDHRRSRWWMVTPMCDRCCLWWEQSLLFSSISRLGRISSWWVTTMVKSRLRGMRLQLRTIFGMMCIRTWRRKHDLYHSVYNSMSYIAIRVFLGSLAKLNDGGERQTYPNYNRFKGQLYLRDEQYAPGVFVNSSVTKHLWEHVA